MIKNLMTRIFALLLCVCLLPTAALANVFEDAMAQSNDGVTPVKRSDFELLFHFYADGFPDDGMMHYEDWEAFADKISLRGAMDSQNFPKPLNRVYFDGGLYLNDKLTVPFEYDAYSTLRFVRSPALGGASVFFHMDNFFEFMLKPFKYIYLPTQYAALTLYPEASLKMWETYAQPVEQTVAGEGNRAVSYDDLYTMCEQLNSIVLEDQGNRAYFYFTSLMIDLGMEWTALEKLGCWEMLLDHLDPQKQGMTIAVENGVESWMLGETTVFEKTVSGGETAVRLYLPDPDGYVFSVEYSRTASGMTGDVLITLDDEEYYHLSAGIDGLPEEGTLTAEGMIWADITGSVLYQEIAPIRLQYAYARNAESKPYSMTLDLDMINAQTEKPCLGLTYTADVEEALPAELEQRTYDNWDDFFSLNEMLLKEHVERFKRTVVLAAAPVALEVPAGVISDVIAFMEENGLLGIFGIE